MSLCESVLQTIEEQAPVHGFQRVLSVRLEIGGLAGVDQEAMRFCFDVVKRDSVAHDSTLEIIELPGHAWCHGCDKQVEVQQRFDPCPDCGDYALHVTDGDEMRIRDLEVE